ncbi:MAG: GAF domain-containing protein [Anaerolineae bacterium]
MSNQPQLSLVRTVSAQVAQVLDLEELARRATSLILDTFKYYHVALFILEPGQETLHCWASAGPTRPQSGAGEEPSVLQVLLGEGIIGHVAQTGVEIIARDVSREPHYRHIDVLPETRSEVALPLKIEERVLGVLDVQSDQRDGFDETDVLVLRALADNIAMAVEHARLYGYLRDRSEQLSAVAEVSRAVASILDLDTLLDRVVRLIREQFGYPFVHLLTVDPARGQIVYRAGSGPRGKVLQEEGLVCRLEDPEAIVPWVACHGETVLVNDLSRESHYRPSEFSEAEALSELAVPLVFGDKVLGVLDVQSDRPDAFDNDDRFLLEALADSVAIAIRNANLYRSERWRRQVADSLREVAGLLSADVALDQVLEAILTELERTLPCDVAAIWLLRDDDLCLSAVHGYEAEMCISDLPLEAGSWLSQVLSADQPVIHTPQSPPEPLGATLGFPSDYSAIAAPLRAGDRRLGVLTLTHHTPGRYGTESRAMTAAFASYAAVAIENTRLYQEAQELARISTAMLRVTEATQSLATLDEVLETIVHLVPMLVGVDRCAIILWDEPAAVFVPAAAFGLTPAQQTTFDQWRVAPGDEPAFDELRRNKAPIFIYDVETDSRLLGPVVWELDFESLLLLPLLAQGEVVGAMLLDYPSDWFEFDNVERLHDERLVIIQGIALQTAAAIENTGLREAQQEEAYVSAALLQVAQAVASLNNLDDILGTIVRITPILVGVQRCIIFLWDDERAIFRPAQTYGVPRDAEATLLARRYAPGDFPLLDAVREHDRQVIYSPDTPDEKNNQIPPDFAASFMPTPAEAPLSSLLALPLSVKGDVLGVMILEEGDTSRRFRQKTRRLEIINGIAHQAALAIQSDLLQQEMAERERLERELQLAHEIQRTFIPERSPNLPGWELAFAWRAARQVAGDFYDFFELPGKRLGLVIADVADKGMPAALFMALTRTLMRAAALEEPSPATALARVNDLLVPDAQSGMFVTLFYGVLSLETGELVYANAGHNPPLLLRSGTGELERLCKGGMALGVLEVVQLEERAVLLETDDCLVLYTDGITEAFSSEGDMYSEERLRATVQAADGHSAQAVLDAIDSSVIAFIGDTPPSDDRTLMVLRRLK